MKFKSSIQI